MKSFKAEALSKLAKLANEGLDHYAVSKRLTENDLIIAGLSTILQCMEEIADLEEELPELPYNRYSSYWGPTTYRSLYQQSQTSTKEDDEDDE